MPKRQRGHREAERYDTVIASGVCIEGAIRADGTLRIDGEVEGTIDTKSDVIIGEGGVIKARIQAENVILAGRIEGDVKVRGRLHIMPQGHLIGNAEVGFFIVEEGATFNGECTMTVKNSDKETKQVKQKVTSPPADEVGLKKTS